MEHRSVGWTWRNETTERQSVVMAPQSVAPEQTDARVSGVVGHCGAGTSTVGGRPQGWWSGQCGARTGVVGGRPRLVDGWVV